MLLNLFMFLFHCSVFNCIIIVCVYIIYKILVNKLCANQVSLCVKQFRWIRLVKVKML